MSLYQVADSFISFILFELSCEEAMATSLKPKKTFAKQKSNHFKNSLLGAMTDKLH